MTVQYFPRPGTGTQVSIFDPQQLAQLRRQAGQDGQNQATQLQVARQFESLFIQNILKQARAANPEGGLFDTQSVRMAQSLGDEQLAMQLADPGIGLAKALQAQMSGQNSEPFGVASHDPEAAHSRRADLRSRMPNDRSIDAASIAELIDKLSNNNTVQRVYSAIQGAPNHIRQFVDRMNTAAKVAAEDSGVPAQLILSQAALESGWGKREIMHADGSTSHNLFGIKATPSWKGKTVDVMTTEYQNGVARKMTQTFRAYDSYAESFADYAKLIGNNKRYESVKQASSPQEAAQRIQEAGYATDPSYAKKLISIMAYFDGGKS
ncbi:flagellar assembly peptidoglycan hydrolase FlgJ [Alcaligenes faecalis]|uniref:flagellar assembly peptidoglycan hydrolase FlgJ n=1 Tax=Alcaligenes faecalis TaxID=511 RepID=UPI000B4DE290|nr:flagellar assembly peptidoglycan hydrolase FlgJ [Alcaligenes faecalis]ASC91287.1 flagellar assembly peptidoglycan hydrolase FlgJ [Alcaligenes faecalis]